MFFIIIPVIVPFWISLGLSMQEIFEHREQETLSASV